MGTWCSGITSASHAEGPGFKSQCVQSNLEFCVLAIARRRQLLEIVARGNANQKHGAHGVVVSHPLCMRKALGSNPSVSTFA